MSAKKEDKLLGELMSQAADWVEEQVPNRMEAVGVDEEEVRKQLLTEADQWVQYNVDQRGKGKEGTPSPDFHLHEKRPPLDPTVRYPSKS